MTMEELWAAIAADVSEELKTLTEVILMKPSQGKDPIGDVKKPVGHKDPHDGGKRPIGGGEVPSVPIYTCGGSRWEDFEWPESGKRPSQGKDPILDLKKDPVGGVKEPDTGGLKKPVKPYKRPIGSGDVPGMPLETKPGGPHYPRPCKPIRF